MCKNSLFSRTSPILSKLQTLLKDPQNAINEQGINLYQDFERCRKEARKMSLPNDVHERIKVILLIPQVNSILELAQRSAKSRAFVKRCLQRFYQEGFEGTQTKPRSGRPQVIRPEHHQLLFSLIDFYPSFLAKQGLFPKLSVQLANSDRWTATLLSKILHVHAANIRNYLKRVNVNLQQKGSHRVEHEPNCQQRLHDIELLTKLINEDYVVLCCGSLANIKMQEQGNVESLTLQAKANDVENLSQSLHLSGEGLNMPQAMVTTAHDSSQEQASSVTTNVQDDTSQLLGALNFSGDLGVTSYQQDLGINLKASGDISTSFEVSLPQESTIFSQSPELAARWYAAMNKHVKPQAATQSGEQQSHENIASQQYSQGHQLTLQSKAIQGNHGNQAASESTTILGNEHVTLFERSPDLHKASSLGVMVAFNSSTHKVYSCFSQEVNNEAWHDFIGRLEKLPQFRNKHLCLIFNKERSSPETQRDLAENWEVRHPNTELHIVEPSSSWIDHVNDLLYSYHSLVLSEPEWQDYEGLKEMSLDFFSTYPEQDELVD